MQRREELKELSKEELIELVIDSETEAESLESDLEELRESMKEGLKEAEEYAEEIAGELDDIKDSIGKVPQTVLGELKKEICDKLMHLNIEVIQEIETKYCEGIIASELNVDYHA